MTANNLNPDATLPRANLGQLLVVWTVWGGMLAWMAWCYVRISSPVPLAEDWNMVDALTGHEASLCSWAWAQNNEHRVPPARLLQLSLLVISGGDFRSGGWFNLVVLAVTSAGLILFLRRMRGGRTETADVFFPGILLHFGHSVNLLLAWQISVLLPVVAVLAIGCVLYTRAGLASRPAATAVALLLPLLPLSGANGLLYVPALLAICGVTGYHLCRDSPPASVASRNGKWLLVSSASTAALTCLYFVGYVHPTWNPPSPGIVESSKAALKTLALGFGPAVGRQWEVFVGLVAGFTIFAAWSQLPALRHSFGAERHRRVAALLLTANAVAFALAVGWARAGYVPASGIPTRYALLAAPALCLLYLCFEYTLTGPVRIWVQRAMAIVALCLVPFNNRDGFEKFGNWYDRGMSAFYSDITAGVAADELARRHQPFLIHWWTPEQLAERMRRLQHQHIAPFDQIERQSNDSAPRS